MNVQVGLAAPRAVHRSSVLWAGATGRPAGQCLGVAADSRHEASCESGQQWPPPPPGLPLGQLCDKYSHWDGRATALLRLGGRSETRAPLWKEGPEV